MKLVQVPTLGSSASTQRIGWALCVLGVYGVMFMLLHGSQGNEIGSMALLPALACGWLLGTRGGFVFGLLNVPLNFLLYTLVGEDAWSIMFDRAAFAYAMVVIMGTSAGWLSDLVRRVREQARELAREREALHQEIIARHQVERELVKAKSEAEEANRAKSVFLASTSHELRTPLSSIIGYSELLQEEAHELGCGVIEEDLRKVHMASKHLLSLINNILDLSKIEAGRMEFYQEEFEVASLVNEVVATVRPLVERNGNQLVIRTNEELGVMNSDKTKMRQILLNLLGNAAKFTSRGTITLELTREEQQGEPWLHFRVQDTGIGMTSEQMAKLFRPFSQGDASLTRRYGGTGLGLAISQHFCQRLGGTIRVESTLGKGSVFTAALPAASLVEENDATLALTQAG